MLVPVLAGVSVVTFALTLMIPGNPVDVLLPLGSPPEVRDAYIREFKLDEPVPQRFGAWLWQAVQGDFGVSIARREPAGGVVLRALANTLVLAGLAFAFSLIVGVATGALLANLAGRRSAVARRLEEALNTLVIAAASVPSFWFGLVLLFIFVVKLRILPVGGVAPVVGDDNLLEKVRYLVLPVVATATHGTATMARYTRTFLMEIAEQDWVHMLRARGYRQSRIVRHQIRNVIPSITNLAGLQAGSFVGGALFAEHVFSRPGMGTAITEAIAARDYPVIQVTILTTGCMFAVITILVDVLMQVLDRRLSAA